MGLTPVWELRCHTPPSKATVKCTSDLIQLKTPGLSAQLLCSQRAGLGSALSQWHSWIWVRYVASLLCPGLRAQTPGSGAFQASSGITGADPLWRKGQVAQQAIRDQRSRPLSGRPHQALPSSCHRHFLVLSHLPDHTLCRDNNLPRPSTAWPPSPSLPVLFRSLDCVHLYVCTCVISIPSFLHPFLPRSFHLRSERPFPGMLL